MALEIITAGDCNANVTISRGELIPTYHCIHPIHTLSYNIGLILENIALEIINMAPEIIKGGESMLTLRYPVRIDPSYTHTRTHKSQNYHVYSAHLELICWKT